MLLLLLTTLGLMWVWINADSSFNTALLHAARWLPAGHSLQTREVQGSIAEGGHIGWLRWQHDGLSVEASGVYLRWSPAALLEGKLHISELAVNTLRVQDQRPAVPDSPTVPPTQLGLPLKVQASVLLQPRLLLVYANGSAAHHKTSVRSDLSTYLIATSINWIRAMPTFCQINSVSRGNCRPRAIWRWRCKWQVPSGKRCQVVHKL